MGIEIREILGWKWQTLEEVAESEKLCLDYFKLPMGEGDITTCVICPMSCYSVYGGIDFYYIGQSEPDQFIPVLGEPTIFKITVISE